MKFTFASRPWSLFDSAVRLCDGADHLLHDHNCDEHGYETLIAARDSMREMLPELSDAQNIADFWAQAHADLERLTAERATLLAPVEGVDLEEVLRLDREGTPGPLYVEGKNLLCEQNGRILAEFRYGTDGARLANVLLAAVFRTAAPALARALMAERAHVRRHEALLLRLQAEAEELRLTLAAEQGKPEGAPSDGWEFDGRDWNKNYTDGSFAGLSGRRGKRRWMRALWPDTERVPTYLGRGHDVETDRAAMLAADAAVVVAKIERLDRKQGGRTT